LIKIVADTRTLEGTVKVYGGPYPAAVLYATSAFIEKNPNTMQALGERARARAEMGEGAQRRRDRQDEPEEYMLGDKPLFVEAIKANHDAYSPDGRFLKNAPETALKVLKAFDPNVQGATIDLSKTLTPNSLKRRTRELTLPLSSRPTSHKARLRASATRYGEREPGPNHEQ